MIQNENSSYMKQLTRSVDWATRSWFLEIDIAVEILNCLFLALWEPQDNSGLVQLYLREGISQNMNNSNQNNRGEIVLQVENENGENV